MENYELWKKLIASAYLSRILICVRNSFISCTASGRPNWPCQKKWYGFIEGLFLLLHSRKIIFFDPSLSFQRIFVYYGNFRSIIGRKNKIKQLIEIIGVNGKRTLVGLEPKTSESGKTKKLKIMSKSASAGSRTRIDCLEGNHVSRYTTDSCC